MSNEQVQQENINKQKFSTYEEYKIQAEEEIFSNDKEKDLQYKKLRSTNNNRYKYAGMYNLALVFGMYYYARNIPTIKYRLGLHKKSLPRILFFTFLHISVPVLLLIPNFFIIWGRHPWKYFLEKRKLEDELMSGDDLIYSFIQFTEFVENQIKTPLDEALKGVKTEKKY
jgi:hypothetical protein